MRLLVGQLLVATVLCIISPDAAGAASCATKAGGQGWKYLVSRSTGSHCWYNPKSGRPDIDSFRLSGRKPAKRFANLHKTVPVPQVRVYASAEEPVTVALATPTPEPVRKPPPAWIDDFDTLFKKPYDTAQLDWPAKIIPVTASIELPQLTTMATPDPAPLFTINPIRLKIAALFCLFSMMLYTLLPLLIKFTSYAHDILLITFRSGKLRRDMRAIEDLRHRNLCVGDGWVMR